jgi:hypothetical protein
MTVVAFSAYSAVRQRDCFAGALACLLLAASAIGLWSATRIDDRIFDHDLFWLSAVGLLVLAVATDTVVDLVWRRGLPHGVAVTAVVALLATAAAGSISCLRTVVHASFEPPAEARIAGQLAADIQSYMARDHVRRPLIKIDQDAWPVAAGAILALQKRGNMTAVEEDWVVMFTPAFRVNGTEDAVVTVAAAAEHLRLRDAGVPEISSHEPVYAHAVRVSGR